MSKKHFRRKAGSGLVRNSLAFTLGAILMAAPVTCWATTAVVGEFESGGLPLDYKEYENMIEAAKEINAKAEAGSGTDPGDSVANDLNLGIHLISSEYLEGQDEGGSSVVLDGGSKGFHDVSVDGHGYSLIGQNTGGNTTGTMLYIANTSGDINISNLNFLNGTAIEQDDLGPEVTYGATGLLINPNGASSTEPGFQNVNLTNLTFQNNRGTISGGASSSGGGMSIFNSGTSRQGGTLTMTGLYLLNNISATNSGPTDLGVANAFGGGAGISNLDKIEYQGGGGFPAIKLCLKVA